MEEAAFVEAAGADVGLLGLGTAGGQEVGDEGFHRKDEQGQQKDGRPEFGEAAVLLEPLFEGVEAGDKVVAGVARDDAVELRRGDGGEPGFDGRDVDDELLDDALGGGGDGVEAGAVGAGQQGGVFAGGQVDGGVVGQGDGERLVARDARRAGHGVADVEGGLPRNLLRRPARDLLHQRQEGRRQRQVAPRAVGGGVDDEDPALAAFAGDEERILAGHEDENAGVLGEVPVEHLLLRDGGERHFGTPRAGKERMVRVGDARGDAVGGQVVALGRFGGQEVEPLELVNAGLVADEERHGAAGVEVAVEAHDGAVAEARQVGEEDDGVGFERLVVELVRGDDVHGTGGGGGVEADGEGLLQEEARLHPLLAALLRLDDKDARRFINGQREIEPVVARQVVALELAVALQRAAQHRRRGELELHVHRGVGVHVHGPLRDALLAEPDLQQVVERRGGAVLHRRDSAHQRAAGGELRAEGDVLDGAVDRRELVGADDDELRAFRVPVLVEDGLRLEAPAGLLIVGDQEDEADAFLGLQHDAPRLAEAGGEIRPRLGRLEGLHGLPRHLVFHRRLGDEVVGAVADGNDGDLVVGLEVVEDRHRLTLGQLQPRLLAGAVGHAEGVVHHQHHRARDVAAEVARRLRRDDRPRRGEDEQRENETSQEEQQQVLDARAAGGFRRDSLQEPQRAERNLHHAPSLEQVDDDWRGHREQSPEHPRRLEASENGLEDGAHQRDICRRSMRYWWTKSSKVCLVEQRR